MKSGRTIGNKETGETLTMLTREEDSGGTLQCYRVNLPAHRPSPPLHYHVAFTGTFTCVEGTLDMYFGRNCGHVRLHVGESGRTDIGQPHTFANTSSTPCIMTIETRPAGE
jgi:mannose-6-phosphate isomerase-like protein (cupin superfamily)